MDISAETSNLFLFVCKLKMHTFQAYYCPEAQLHYGHWTFSEQDEPLIQSIPAKTRLVVLLHVDDWMEFC